MSAPAPRRRSLATALSLTAVVSAVAALVLFVLALTVAREFTESWGVAVVGLLALAASLFSAAAATSSAETGHRATSAANASATTALHAYGQQLYELARQVHLDLTTGEVAVARDLLGTLGRSRLEFWATGGPAADLHHDLADRLRSTGYVDPDAQLEAARRAWFTLLWCFERVLAARRLLAQAPPEVTHGTESPLSFLDGLVRTQVRFLDEEAAHARSAIEEFFAGPLDDRESATGFRELVRLLLDGAPPGRWSLPLSTHAGVALEIVLTAVSPTRLKPEDLTTYQYQALHCHLHGSGADATRRGLVRDRLRERAVELERPGGPEHPGIGDDQRSASDLRFWARILAAPDQTPIPRTWPTP